MAHNIPLQILDEYAKSLSTKQAEMLYEHKLNRKYKKSLNEGKEYQTNKNSNIFLTQLMLNEAHMTIGEVIDKFVEKHDLQYNIFNNGIHLYTPYNEDYNMLLSDLVENGFSKDLLISMANTQKEKEMIQKL